MRKNVEKTKPRDDNELVRNKYCVQNMLMDQVNFPSFYHDGDYIDSIYSDRLPCDEYSELLKKHFPPDTKNFEFSSPDREKMMALLEDHFRRKLTGYRIVRWTHVATQYPVFRFDVFAKADDTPIERLFTGQEGDNVIGREVRDNSCYFDSFLRI